MTVPRAAEVKVRVIREATDALLSQCTEKQVEFFHRIHNNAPYKGWENCPDDLIDVAHDLVARTVEANLRGEP